MVLFWLVGVAPFVTADQLPTSARIPGNPGRAVNGNSWRAASCRGECQVTQGWECVQAWNRERN